MLDPIFDPIFRLIGGARQLPIYLFLLPIPILLWLFWAEYRASTGRDSPFGERVVHLVDGLNSAIGKTFGWCILVLTFTTAYEVFSRYVFRAPTEWAFDASYMLYGTLFMMAGAYAMARNAHVRGDFIYRSWSPRTQAKMDLVLFILFYFPGMLAFIYAGYGFAELSRQMNEHSAAKGLSGQPTSRPIHVTGKAPRTTVCLTATSRYAATWLSLWSPAQAGCSAASSSVMSNQVSLRSAPSA